MIAENYKEAYDYCNKALEIDPSCGTLWENKAICCFWLRTDNDIKFDEDIFNEYHLYVEDYCAQLSRLKNQKIYTIGTNSKESDPNDIYQLGNAFLNHHSCTVSSRGFCWGRYHEFRQKLENKWPLIKTT